MKIIVQDVPITFLPGENMTPSAQLPASAKTLWGALDCTTWPEVSGGIMEVFMQLQAQGNNYTEVWHDAFEYQALYRGGVKKNVMEFGVGLDQFAQSGKRIRFRVIAPTTINTAATLGYD